VASIYNGTLLVSEWGEFRHVLLTRLLNAVRKVLFRYL